MYSVTIIQIPVFVKHQNSDMTISYPMVSTCTRVTMHYFEVLHSVQHASKFVKYVLYFWKLCPYITKITYYVLGYVRTRHRNAASVIHCRCLSYLFFFCWLQWFAATAFWFSVSLTTVKCGCVAVSLNMTNLVVITYLLRRQKYCFHLLFQSKKKKEHFII